MIVREVHGYDDRGYCFFLLTDLGDVYLWMLQCHN